MGDRVDAWVWDDVGQLSGYEDLNNNSLKGELPAFLRRGPDGFKRHPDDGVNASREVGIVGNPYYCPLRPWALELFEGVECNHCPSDVDTTDFTFTCSGHGVCADGVCECEPLWAHFSTDCSMLGCPRVEEIDLDTGEEILQHCNGAGECYNTVNASAVCGPNGKADFDYASAFAGRDIEQIIDNLKEIDRWEMRRLLREEGILIRLQPETVTPE